MNIPDCISPRDQANKFFQNIFDSTDEILDLLNDGEKIDMETLCSQIAAKLSISSYDKVYYIVTCYLHNRPDIQVVCGARGGVFKGFKPAKPSAAEEKARRAANKFQKNQERARVAQLRIDELRKNHNKAA